MFFQVLKTAGRARTGVIHTDHGDILTPTYMPVGTQATVKAVANRDLQEIGSSVILGNTYHLHLRPGEDLIAELGGLHKFMNYPGPILTDSGGFQVFSLGKETVKVDAAGVNFKSYLDGATHRFTPSGAIAIQKKLGADIIMALDICTHDDASFAEARQAMETTHRWAEECVAADAQPGPHNWTQNLFGIIQGANHRALREESARFITALPFAGIAIGGESIGYNMAATVTTLDWLENLLPPDKPRYTMGVGYSPRDLFTVIERGVDIFDCVAPTRVARNGTLYCRQGENFKINIRNAVFRRDARPVDDWCDCYTCQHHSRAYLRHLLQADELLFHQLASIHNLRFLLKLGEEIRAAINRDEFGAYRATWIK